MIKKYIAFVIILISCLITLTGCYDARGIEELAYVVAIGIDKGSSTTLRLSFQFAVPSEKSSDSGEGSSQSSSSDVTTVDCNSINEGISLMNAYTSKQVNLSHCKIILFGENLAVEGLANHIYTLVNNNEIRPNTNVLVTKSTAEDFLNHSKPMLEQHTARYYETILNSYLYTGFTTSSNLLGFYSDLKSLYKEPTAVLGEINDDDEVQNMGVAIFKKDYLIGELNGLESIYCLIASGKLQSCIITVPSPFDNQTSIDFYVTLQKKTKNNVQIVNGSPYIDSKIYLSANILSMGEGSDYSNDENVKLLEEYSNNYLKKEILTFLYKTAKDFKSDIIGFGEDVINDYLFYEDWESSNWLENYKNSTFNVNVELKIKHPYMLVES